MNKEKEVVALSDLEAILGQVRPDLMADTVVVSIAEEPDSAVVLRATLEPEHQLTLDDPWFDATPEQETESVQRSCWTLCCLIGAVGLAFGTLLAWFSVV